MAEEAFAKMLQDPAQAKMFDLHKVERDSNGVEKAMKVDKDAIAHKTKTQAMAREVTEAIFN